MSNSGEQRGTVMVPQEVVEAYQRVRAEGVVETKRYYFKHIMPLYRSALEHYAGHQAVRAKQYHTLVSLMGLSPETTVQACVITKPKKLVVVGSDNEIARKAARPGLEYLQQEGLIDFFSFKHVFVDAHDTQDIYEKLSEVLKSNEESILLDITGGTKVMSATAGALAWELNLDICYLGEAFGAQHSVLAVKPNPSRSRGFQYRKEALDAYELGNFAVAGDRFLNSQRLIADSFFDLLGLELCRCYSAFLDFDRARLEAALQELEETLEVDGVHRLLSGVRERVEAHLRALREFSGNGLLARTAAFAEIAEIHTRQERFDLAGLFWRRAAESVVEWRLDRLEPKCSALKARWEMMAARLPTEPRAVEVEMNRMVAKMRNKSYLAQGSGNLGKEDANTLRESAAKLAKAVLGDDFAEFEMQRQHLRRLDIAALANTSAQGRIPDNTA